MALTLMRAAPYPLHARLLYPRCSRIREGHRTKNSRLPTFSGRAASPQEEGVKKVPRVPRIPHVRFVLRRRRRHRRSRRLRTLLVTLALLLLLNWDSPLPRRWW